MYGQGNIRAARPQILRTVLLLAIVIVSITVLQIVLVYDYSVSRRSFVNTNEKRQLSWSKGIEQSLASYNQDHDTSRQLKRHPGFAHGKKNKLWEHVDGYNVIIRPVAYHDTRNKNSPAIVLVALHDDRQKIKPNLYLLLSYSSNITQCVPMGYWIKSGTLDKHMREYYVNYMLKTIGDIKDETPLCVSVTTDKTCKTGLTGHIPVQGTELLPGAATYAICLHKGLFHLKDPQVLINWIELNKELGAEFITVYNQNIPENMFTNIKPYIESGYIEVLDWSLRRPLIPIDYTRDYGQSGLINECIYRNMNHVKYLGLFDMDEFIIPGPKYRKVTEILPILEQNTKSKPVGAYVFYNTFFYDNHHTVPEIQNKTLCPGMKMPLYFLRTSRASHPQIHLSYKMIVKPVTINSVQLHYVVNKQDGFEKHYKVPPEIGASHHYRTPPNLFGETSFFYSPDVGRYVSAVLPRIEKQMCRGKT